MSLTGIKAKCLFVMGSTVQRPGKFPSNLS